MVLLSYTYTYLISANFDQTDVPHPKRILMGIYYKYSFDFKWAEKYHMAYKIVKTECKLVRSVLTSHGFHEVSLLFKVLFLRLMLLSTSQVIWLRSSLVTGIPVTSVMSSFDLYSQINTRFKFPKSVTKNGTWKYNSWVNDELLSQEL